MTDTIPSLTLATGRGDVVVQIVRTEHGPSLLARVTGYRYRGRPVAGTLYCPWPDLSPSAGNGARSWETYLYDARGHRPGSLTSAQVSAVAHAIIADVVPELERVRAMERAAMRCGIERDIAAVADDIARLETELEKARAKSNVLRRELARWAGP